MFRAWWMVVGLLAFVGCVSNPLVGLHRRSYAPNSEVVVEWGDHLSVAGLTYGFRDQPQRVYIRRGLLPARTLAVTIHELVHVAGYGGHLKGEGYTDVDGRPDASQPPSDEELSAMQAIPWTYTVYVHDIELYFVVLRAGEFWNKHLGHKMFTVTRISLPI